MDLSEEFHALEQIKQVKARYWRAVDSKDRALLRSVFTEDVVVDVRGSTGTDDAESGLINGVDNFVPYCLDALFGVTTVHHGHCPEITFTSDTSAKGIWAMEDFLWVDETSVLPFRKLRGWGHYYEEYSKTPVGWKISKMRLDRIKVEVET